MKHILITLSLLILTNLVQAQNSEGLKQSSPTPFTCVDIASPDYGKVKVAMRAAAQQITVIHPEFANYGFGYGNCIDLKKNSVLSFAAGRELTELPDTCVGFSLAATSPQELSVLAQQLVGIQDAQIDGKNGSMIIFVDGSQINVPICLDSFSFGGPQQSTSLLN